METDARCQFRVSQGRQAEKVHSRVSHFILVALYCVLY